MLIKGLTGGTNAFNYCFGQNDGGYGDEFVIIAAGNVTVNVTHSKFKYNTQDGFDGHISDDVTTSPIINISDSVVRRQRRTDFQTGHGRGFDSDQ